MKLLGAVIILLSCGWFGYSMASAHRAEEKCLRTLISALDYMQCELQYKLTPLPELCAQAGRGCRSGRIHDILLELGRRLELKTDPDPASCLQNILQTAKNIPQLSQQCLESFARSLGQFDLDGQVASLESVRQECRDKLQSHCVGKENQRRSYQTLGICGGAALVILFI